MTCDSEARFWSASLKETPRLRRRRTDADSNVVRAPVAAGPLIQHCDSLDWLLLTKRPENVPDVLLPSLFFPGAHCYPDNVWCGTTVGTQPYADERIPHLLKLDAVIRFISYEPGAPLCRSK
jgi:hypothetical protein